jgi:hypothetical protein
MLETQEEEKYKEIFPIGCICVGKKRLISDICGCVGIYCKFDTWQCTKCEKTKRYKSWVVVHYDNNH